MNSIEELRKKYYESIILLQDEQDILDALPQPEYTNFFPIISGLIQSLENELHALTQELKSQNENEMKEYIEEEIKTLSFKKELCQALLETATEEKNIIEEAEKPSKKNLIFATTNSGNICIENDIKTLPEEYYEILIEQLQRLQNGIEEDNIQKNRGMTSVNKKMFGIHEVKSFKVRLVYKILAKDTIYVLMAKMKKSDNDALDRKEIIIRATQRNQQYKQLKQQIKKSQIKEELIVENEKILSEIYNYLSQNKRGK